jgi:hypothetical protein
MSTAIELRDSAVPEIIAEAEIEDDLLERAELLWLAEHFELLPDRVLRQSRPRARRRSTEK